MALFLKTAALYVIVVAALRIMGKRQIHELQPSELVITLLVSEIAAAPLQDSEKSIGSVMIPLLTLIVFELITSVLNIKSVKFRNFLQGNSAVIIRDGQVDQKQLKKLRYSLEDLLEELRKKDIFDISEVQYAIAETDGSISILPIPEKRNVTPSDLNLSVEHDSAPVTVIDDGVIVYDNLNECNLTEKKLMNMIREKKLDIKKILLMQTTIAGNTTIILKDK